MKKILWIHGRATVLSNGTSSWLLRKKDLEDRWYFVDLPQFPSSKDPAYKSWEQTLKTLDIEKYDCIISTSHWGWVIINYLKENNLSVPKLIIVCPGKSIRKTIHTQNFYNELLNKDIDLSSQIKNIYVLHSKDDELVPFENGKEIAKKIGANFIEYNWLWHQFTWEWIKIVNDLV